jgi:hypothetical protein
MSSGWAAGICRCVRESGKVRGSHHILIVSYMFPPAGGIAVQRALSFARYLPECGCRVTVLTARNPAVPMRDESLLAKIPPTVAVERTFTPEIPFSAREALWKLLGRGGGKGTPGAAGTNAGGLGGRVKRLARDVLKPDPEVVWVPFARLAPAARRAAGGYREPMRRLV